MAFSGRLRFHEYGSIAAGIRALGDAVYSGEGGAALAGGDGRRPLGFTREMLVARLEEIEDGLKGGGDAQQVAARLELTPPRGLHVPASHPLELDSHRRS